jgi:hypothetical protein
MQPAKSFFGRINMASWSGTDLREYERIGSENIPDCLKRFCIEQGTGEKIKGETTDFTVKGVRLLIPCSSNEFCNGDGIIIYPEDESFKLVGEIIHIIGLDEKTAYAGIRFLRTKSLVKYHKILEEYALIDSDTVNRINI